MRLRPRQRALLSPTLPAGRLLVFSLILFFFGAALPAAAGEPVAEVVAVRGAVTATTAPDGAARTLAVKAPIFREDTIDTGANGRLQLMFKDNTVVSLGQNSRIAIAQYEYDLATQKGKMTTEVKEGVFRIMGGIITRTSPESFETKTPAGTIGIRGSMYAGTVRGGELDVVFEGGKGITLTNATGTVEISTPGYGTSVKGFDQPPEPPYRYAANQIEALQKNLGPAAPAAPPGTTPSGGAGAPGGAAPSGQGAGAGGGGAKNAAQLTELVKVNPEQAREALREAVAAGGMNVEEALGAVLTGMRSPSPEAFNSVVNEAVDQGLTLDDAKALVERLKASGGFCK